MAFGEKVELRLGPLGPALARPAPGADGGLRLDDIPAGAELVALGVEEREHALLLVVRQQELPGGPQGVQAGEHRAANKAPADARHENGEESRGGDQQGRAEVRLAHDERTGQRNQEQADAHVARPRRQDPVAEVPGHGHRHGELHDFRGLEAEHAKIEPALCALGADADQGDGQQQDHARQVGPGRPARPAHGADLGNGEHHQVGEHEVTPLAQHRVAALARGAVQHHEAEGREDQQERDEGHVHVQLPRQARGALEGPDRVGHLADVFGHQPACASIQASITVRAIG